MIFLFFLSVVNQLLAFVFFLQNNSLIQIFLRSSAANITKNWPAIADGP